MQSKSHLTTYIRYYLGWQIKGHVQTGPFCVSLLHAKPLGEVELAKQPFNNNIGKIRKTTLEKEFTMHPLKS